MVSARDVVSAIADPEIPVISIHDLGVLRDVEVSTDGTVIVTITPTYSGCPAMDAIRSDIRTALTEHGFEQVEIRTVLQPAWTTDWISERGRKRLQEFGIAPPRSSPLLDLAVACPRCGSRRTRLVSRFGSTACKAHRACLDCQEPFDHFKEY
jgi:ring-1,2-phenylacetyl-CoA epoxidase subunit PaaD